MTPKDKNLGRAIWGGNLRTVRLNSEEINSMISLAQYALNYNVSKSTVYWYIRSGRLVSKKFKSRVYVLPVKVSSKVVFRR
jgi:hypothetical protein